MKHKKLWLFWISNTERQMYLSQSQNQLIVIKVILIYLLILGTTMNQILRFKDHSIPESLFLHHLYLKRCPQLVCINMLNLKPLSQNILQQVEYLHKMVEVTQLFKLCAISNKVLWDLKKSIWKQNQFL